jgi:2-keto-4-pentenoate hydratase/2-oxohepta-3-ene-1,7-dioic acid hydratase in catechol pathway
MRLLSFEHNGTASYGIAVNGGIIDAGKRLAPGWPTLRSALAGEGLGLLEAMQHDQPDLDRGSVRFLPVIPQPGKIICVGVNYLAHIKEMGRDIPERPVLFVRFADSQVGHEQPLVHPGVSEHFDYEGELAVVIGRSAHRVTAAEALNHVAGYSCFNDGSVRDYQRHTSQFTAGKNFRHSGSFGPWLVTRDEIPDPGQLQLETRLNGKVMQSAPLSDLCFSVPALLEYCSTFARLEPGDVLLTGTPGGVGAARTPPVWLVPGDTVEVQIDAIGVLRNPVAAG